MRLLYFCALTALGGASCRQAPQLPDIGGLYDRSAKEHASMRNPVVVIPGLLGSSLRDIEGGQVVWGSFSGDYAKPNQPDGMRSLALPMGEGRTLSELRDTVVSDGALEEIELRLLGLPFFLVAYRNILATLGVGGYRDESLGISGSVDYGDEHFTCFQFDYDWRRDIGENAQRLEAFLREKRAYVEAENERRFGHADPVRFDLVAHSMGGLITRWFLRYGSGEPEPGAPVPWSGAELVEHAILIAPPNAGALSALEQLVQGYCPTFLVPSYPPALIGTMPSLYQLMPRGRHAAVELADGSVVTDLLDPALWREQQWGLANPEQEDALAVLLEEHEDPATRRRIALDHLDKCLARARIVTEALDLAAQPPPGLKISLFAGDAIGTAARAKATGRNKLTTSEWAPGDGTVLRSSALLDERTASDWTPGLRSPIAWGQVFFLFDDHLELTMNPVFIDNVLYLLLEAPRQ